MNMHNCTLLCALQNRRACCVTALIKFKQHKRVWVIWSGSVQSPMQVLWSWAFSWISNRRYNSLTEQSSRFWNCLWQTKLVQLDYNEIEVGEASHWISIKIKSPWWTRPSGNNLAINLDYIECLMKRKKNVDNIYLYMMSLRQNF